MNNLKVLSDYAKSLGAHAPLKLQPGQYYTLFVYLDEIPNDYKDGTTTWNHLITVDELEGGVKIRYRGGEETSILDIKEAMKTIKSWIEKNS